MKRIIDRFSLDGKTAFVTGAAAWLGWDAACVLAEAGCDVALSSRNLEKAQEASVRLQKLFPKIRTLGVELDHGSADSVERAFGRVMDWNGRLDILVNNAGGGSGGSPGDIGKRSTQDVDAMIQSNLTGVLYCCRSAANLMVPRETGVIISIASMAGLIGRDRRMYRRSGMNAQPVDYAAAKAGIIGMTRDLAASLGAYGIRVNSISPGGFDKGVLPQRFVDEYADSSMLGRWGKFESDIGGPILFLASDASSYVTGHNLVVDGGFSLFK